MTPTSSNEQDIGNEQAYAVTDRANAVSPITPAPDGPVRCGHLSQRQRTRAKLLVRLLAFVYHLSLSVLFTTFTELLLGFYGGSYAKAAAYLGTCSGVERALQFFTSPLLGTLSDMRGRRALLLGSLLLPCMALVAIVLRPNPQTVLMYSLANGLVNVTLVLTNAMVTDLASDGGEADIAKQFGRVGVGIGLALIVGPAVGPQLAKLHVTAPIWASVACLLVGIVIWALLPETLDLKHRRQTFTWSDANPFLRLRRAFEYRGFRMLALPFFLSQAAECVYQFSVLYFKRRFNWTYEQMGLYIAAVGICIAFVQGNLRLVVPRLISEKACIVLGFAGHAGAMITTGLVSNGWLLYATVAPQMLASLKHPGLMGVISGNVPVAEQGVLQGSMNSVRVLAKTVGSPVFGQILSYSSRGTNAGTWKIGLPFLVAGLIDFIAMVLMLLIFAYMGPPPAVTDHKQDDANRIEAAHDIKAPTPATTAERQSRVPDSGRTGTSFGTSVVSMWTAASAVPPEMEEVEYGVQIQALDAPL